MLDLIKKPFIWIGAVFNYIQNHFKTVLLLLILILVFGSQDELKHPNLAVVKIEGEILNVEEILENIEDATKDEKIKGVKEKKQNALVAQLRLRQKSSYLKIPYTVEHIYDLLENNHQVAVSVNFKETLFEIKNQLEKEDLPESIEIKASVVIKNPFKS